MHFKKQDPNSSGICQPVKGELQSKVKQARISFAIILIDIDCTS